MLCRMRVSCGLAFVVLLVPACAHRPSRSSQQPVGWSGPASLQPPDAGSAVTAPDAKASAARASRPAATPRLAPVEPLGCEPVAGSVRFRAVGVPKGCRSLRSGDVGTEPGAATAPTGLAVVESADGFRDAFRCDPPVGVDFSARRLVAYSFVHDSDRTYSLAGVVRAGGELHIVFDIGRLCQGARPRAHRTVKLIVVPRGSERVRVAFCNMSRSCGPVP